MTSLVVRTQNGSPTLIPETLPLPEPQSHQALIRVTHVAQNPNDVQSFDSNAFGDGTVLGCDFVGQVIKIGDAVTKIKSGDTIAGEFKGLGAYSEYILADESICFPISTGISLEQASTVPLAALTSWLAVLSPGCLNIDRNLGSEITLLIWGGSSSVGLYAIQLASLFNFQIITTCSPTRPRPLPRRTPCLRLPRRACHRPDHLPPESNPGLYLRYNRIVYVECSRVADS
ncbi:hypothetical protein AWENTII_005365 [Aspergillus wentii]